MKRRMATNYGELAGTAITAGLTLMLFRWAQLVATWQFVTIDALGLAFVGGALLFGGALFAGHVALHEYDRSEAAGYAAVGAIGGLLAFFGIAGPDVLQRAQWHDELSLAIAAPLVLGALFGLIYRARAGVERVDGDRIEGAIAAHDGPPLALIDGEPDQEHYYKGPVEVRTSLGLLFAAGGAVGALMAALLLVLALSGSMMMTGTWYEAWGYYDPYFARRGSGAAIAMILICCFSLFVPNLIGHRVAQYFKVTTVGGYTGVGLAANLVLGLLVPPFLVMAPFAAASLGLYRRWVGLQPVGLPEDVWVRDKRALVAADHPARQYHRVIAE